MFVKILDSYVKGSVCCVCADNLGARALAGSQENVNVKNFCRFCLTNRGDTATTAIFRFSAALQRTAITCLQKLSIENLAHVKDV